MSTYRCWTPPRQDLREWQKCLVHKDRGSLDPSASKHPSASASSSSSPSLHTNLIYNIDISSSYQLLEGRHWVTERFLSLPPGRGTVCRQQSLLRQPCIHFVEPWKLIYSPHLSHHLSYIICILRWRNMSLTMLGDLAVFWLYVTLICSFLYYITLHYLQLCASACMFLIVGQTAGLIRTTLATRILFNPGSVLGKTRSRLESRIGVTMEAP